MNKEIEKHHCLIQILALIDLAEEKNKKTFHWISNYFFHFPELGRKAKKEIEITHMAINRLKARYKNQLNQLINQ